MSKPPVLLFHGLTGAPAELQSVSRALRRAGYEVETPMLPGHGMDEAALLKTDWRDWLGACEQDLLRVTADGGQAFVGGLSMGAVLGLALAEKYPDKVKGVAAFAPTLRYDGWATPGGSWFIPIGKHLPFVNRWRFMERPPYGIKDERLRAVIEEMMFSGSTKDAGLPFMPGLSLASNLVLVNKVERQLAKVTAPLLIVHATEDDITHIRNAERLAAKVSGPVRKLYLENSYHLVTVDQERAKVALATVAFFDELAASGALAASNAA